MPPVTFIGTGSLQSAGSHLNGLGLKKALVVTDAPLLACGATAAVTDMLERLGIGHAVYSGVEPNPTVEQVRWGGPGGRAGARHVLALCAAPTSFRLLCTLSGRSRPGRAAERAVRLRRLVWRRVAARRGQRHRGRGDKRREHSGLRGKGRGKGKEGRGAGGQAWRQTRPPFPALPRAWTSSRPPCCPSSRSTRRRARPGVSRRGKGGEAGEVRGRTPARLR